VVQYMFIVDIISYFCKKSLKKRKMTKKQTMIYKTLLIKVKIEQHEPH
jgi:CDP-diglyceride synthetase